MRRPSPSACPSGQPTICGRTHEPGCIAGCGPIDARPVCQFFLPNPGAVDARTFGHLPDRWPPMTERDLFIAALRQQDPAARAAFLDRATAGDTGLRGRVDAMLAEHDQLGSFLEHPAVVSAGDAARPFESPTATVRDPAVESPGRVIGSYKLVEQIGEGGMGTVFLAQQQQPVKRL